MDTTVLQRLAERSKQRSIYVYTDFLEETDQRSVFTIDKHAFLWGGADFCTRKMARFGTPDEVGYDEEFPIAILQIKLLGGKFATVVTHRDVLGAMMNLGVAREKIGDIFAGSTSYVVVADALAEYFCQNLCQVGKNRVEVSLTSSLPNELAPKTEEKRISSESDRVDAIVARVYNMSRGTAQETIDNELVKINGEICTKPMRSLRTNDTVSVRGYGKFRFCGADGQSKKGKTYFVIQIYR